jgi:carbon monoxide dehydrogenase subunit G
MNLENTLRIPVLVDEAWRVLLDIERITPCLPGATLTSRDGDTYHGKIKVKLGAIGLIYGGTVTFLTRDESTRTIVLSASGRETRGNGTASAQVTCRLVGADESTDVFIDTELSITGRPAQFGRGALVEVSGALVGRFAENLAAELSTPATPARPAITDSPRPLPPRTAEPVDLMAVVGTGARKRVAAGAVGLLILALSLLSRRRRRTGGATPKEKRKQ